MKKLFKLKILITLLLTTFLYSLKAQVPDDAQWAMVFEMSKFKESELGKIMQNAKDPSSVQKLQFLQNVFDFDPWKDLDSITIHGDGKPMQAISQMNGSFNSEKIISFISQNPHYELKDMNGVSVHYVKMRGQFSRYIYFQDDETIFIAHNENDMNDAIAISRNEISSDVLEAPDEPNAFFLGYANMDAIAQNNPRAKFFVSAIDFSEITVEAQGDELAICLSMDALDEAQSNNLELSINGLFALGKIRFQQKPQMLEWLNTINVSRDENRIKVEANVTNEMIIQKMKKMREKKWNHNKATGNK